MEPIKNLTFNTLPKSISFEKFSNETYHSLHELREDFEWFIHFCFSMHKTDSRIIKAANHISEVFENHMSDITKCVQCYENACNDPFGSFAEMCDPPHLLIWVNCGKLGYLPAKVLHCDEKRDEVTVRFSDERKIYVVPFNACLMFSMEIPDNGHAHEEKPFDFAMKVNCIIDGAARWCK